MAHETFTAGDLTAVIGDNSEEKGIHGAGYNGVWCLTHRTARFPADRNPVTNIDAGIVGRRFFLATGGDIRNAGTRLDDPMELPATAENRNRLPDCPADSSSTASKATEPGNGGATGDIAGRQTSWLAL